MAAAAAAATTSCCSTKLVYLSSPIPVVSPPKSRCTMKMKMAASNSKSKNCLFVEARFGTFKTGGAGVIEKPGFDQSQFDPSTQVLEGNLFSFFFLLCYLFNYYFIPIKLHLPYDVLAIAGGDIGKMKDKRGTGSGDSYRVLLIDDTRHSEKLGM